MAEDEENAADESKGGDEDEGEDSSKGGDAQAKQEPKATTKAKIFQLRIKISLLSFLKIFQKILTNLRIFFHPYQI